MKRIKLILVLYIAFGFLLLAGGTLLAYVFNEGLVAVDRILRYVGLGVGFVMIFIGSHIAFVGIDSVRKLGVSAKAVAAGEVASEK